MKSFRQWREQQDAPLTGQSPEAWKMSKAEALQHWQQLQPGMPMSQLRVIPPDHKGPTYRYDGVRVTGSGQFIDSVMSRLKDILSYESESTRLNLVYRQQVDSKLQEPIPDSFVFYAQARDRKSGQGSVATSGHAQPNIKQASPLTPPMQ